MSDIGIHKGSNGCISLDEIADAPVVAMDVEASGTHLDRDIPYGYSITCRDDSSFFTGMHDSFFSDIVTDENRGVIAHNAKYERSMLKKKGIVRDEWIDTMIAAHLLEYPELSLEFLSRWIYHENIMTYTDLPEPLESLSFQGMADNLGVHSEVTYKLWNVLYQGLKKYQLTNVFFDIEMPIIPVLSDIELNGVAVDVDTLKNLGDVFDKKLGVLTQSLDYWSDTKGYNHNSPDQAASIIYDRLELPVSRSTPEGKRPSVDKRYLSLIKSKHPYLSVYLAYKELMTLKSSYVNSLIRDTIDGRIYGSFNQHRTRTGRLSASDPNLQKIPKRTELGRLIRTAFIAPEGHKLLKVDYKLIELIMMAYWSQDEALIAAFRAGRDIHTETAIRAYRSEKERAKGKTLNYKVIFGGGDKKDKDAFYNAYPGVKKWTDAMGLQLRNDMYAKTRGGRIRSIDELDPDGTARTIERGVREGISTMIQGSSAEEVKKGMARAHKVLRNSDVKPVLQVHDEMVYQVPDRDVNDVIDVIWQTFPTMELEIPLTVDISVGDNWGESVEVKEGEKYVFAK